MMKTGWMALYTSMTNDISSCWGHLFRHTELENTSRQDYESAASRNSMAKSLIYLIYGGGGSFDWRQTCVKCRMPSRSKRSARQWIGLLKIKIAIGFRVRHAQTRRSDYGRLILESNARRVWTFARLRASGPRDSKSLPQTCVILHTCLYSAAQKTVSEVDHAPPMARASRDQPLAGFFGELGRFRTSVQPFFDSRSSCRRRNLP